MPEGVEGRPSLKGCISLNSWEESNKKTSSIAWSVSFFVKWRPLQKFFFNDFGCKLYIWSNIIQWIASRRSWCKSIGLCFHQKEKLVQSYVESCLELERSSYCIYLIIFKLYRRSNSSVIKGTYMLLGTDGSWSQWYTATITSFLWINRLWSCFCLNALAKDGVIDASVVSGGDLLSFGLDQKSQKPVTC